MASVKKRPDGKWRARYIDPDGVERSKHFARKQDADEFLTRVEEAKLRGAYVNPTDRTTVGEYAARWVANRPYRDKSRITQESKLHAMARYPLWRARLGGVLPSDVQAFATQMHTDGGSPTSVRNAVGLLRSVFGAAMLDGLMGRNPALSVALPRVEHRRVVEALSRQHVERLAAAMPEPWLSTMTLFHAATGLRLGELAGERWSDVDLARRTVHVARQIDEYSRVCPPKTPGSVRTIPITAELVELLDAHAGDEPTGDGLVFHQPGTGKHARNVYSSALSRAARELAADDPAFERISTHDMRHHFASAMLRETCDPALVAKLLGHSNANLVISTYAHAMPGTEERARRALAAIWGWSGMVEVDSETDQARTGDRS